MTKKPKLTYEDFLHHKSMLITTFEVALMEASVKFEEEHGSIAQLDWFCSNANKHIQQAGLRADDLEVTAVAN
jgi:hypothetical protein